MQLDITLQTNAATQVCASRHEHPTATSRNTSVDGTVDGCMVQRPSVAFGTILTYIITTRGISNATT